ncbi:MAG TPA: NUDIX domain-containing protein [Devosiaceae bacterium]|nr:NUDIX domain-containing protein [Devosiaceae bacterium]
MDKYRWHRRRLRLYLNLMGLKRRMTLGTRTMLIDGDRIYLIRHTYSPGWHLPGGGVEPGETIEAAAAREVSEESGYRVTGSMELFGIYLNNFATNRDHVALFVCREFEEARAYTGDLEIAECGWFALDALPPETSDGTRRRLAEVFYGAGKEAHW